MTLDLKSKPRRVPRLPIELVREVSVLIYGPGWQSALSRDTGISTRTIQRWTKGMAPMPDAMLDFLLNRCRIHQAKLHIVRSRLSDLNIERLDFEQMQG